MCSPQSVQESGYAVAEVLFELKQVCSACSMRLPLAVYVSEPTALKQRHHHTARNSISVAGVLADALLGIVCLDP